MRLVLKFGGTSLSSPNHIRNVAKIVTSFSKDNEIVVVCSAVDGTTDDLLTISRLIEQKKKDDVTKALNNIIKKHKLKNSIIISDKGSKSNIFKSARNIPNLKIIDQEGANAYDLLKYKNVIFTTSSIKTFQDRVSK